MAVSLSFTCEGLRARCLGNEFLSMVFKVSINSMRCLKDFVAVCCAFTLYSGQGSSTHREITRRVYVHSVFLINSVNGTL